MPDTSPPPTRTDAPQALVLVAAFVTVALWASAFIGIRAAAAYFDPGALAVLRMLVGTLFLGLIALRHGIRPRRSAAWGSSPCGVLPAMAILMPWLILGEVPTLMMFLGGALCLLGVLLTKVRR